LDLHARSAADRVASSVRVGHDAFAAEWRGGDGRRFVDAIAVFDVRLSKRWTLPISAIASFGERSLQRLVTGARYESRAWTTSFAVSPLVTAEPGIARTSIDTRAEVIRRAARAAGLAMLEWRLGADTRTTHFELATARLWRNDIGAWSSVGANLSSRA